MPVEPNTAQIDLILLEQKDTLICFCMCLDCFQVFYTEIRNGDPMGTASLLEVPLSLDMLTTVSVQKPTYNFLTNLGEKTVTTNDLIKITCTVLCVLLLCMLKTSCPGIIYSPDLLIYLETATTKTIDYCWVKNNIMSWCHE